MRVLVKEYATTLSSIIVAILIILFIAPTGRDIGDNLKNLYVMQEQDGQDKVKAITPSDDNELPTNAYDTITLWTGIIDNERNERIKYSKLSGDAECTFSLHNQIITVTAPENCSDAKLDDTDLECHGKNIEISLDQIKGVAFYDLKFHTGNKEMYYVISR